MQVNQINSLPNVNGLHNILENIDKRLLELSLREITLNKGLSSRSFYFLYRYKQTGQEAFLDYSTNDLKVCIENSILNLSVKNSLFHGVSGILWLYDIFVNAELIEYEKKIDEYFYKYLLKSIDHFDHDLIHGYIGVAIAACTSRYKESEVLIKNVVSQLSSKLIPQGEILTIKSYNQYYAKYEFTDNSQVYNLGMAHGLASVLSFLSIISYSKKANINHDLIRSIVFTIKHFDSVNVKNGFRFNSYYTTSEIDSKTNSQRLAWCYCDLGISFSLINASKALNDPELLRYALDIAKNSLKIESQYFRIDDYSLCHGYSGLLHMASLLYQYDPNESIFLDMMRYSIEYLYVGNEKILEMNNPGILNGLSGIGLSIMSVLNDKDTDWNRCLLLS